MDEKELELAKEEFRATRDTFTTLSIQRTFEFENRENRIIESKRSSLITFSSLAIAMVAIVFPIYTDNETISCFFVVPIVLLMISALYGIGLVIFSDKKEESFSKLQNDAEQTFVTTHLTEVVQIYSKAIDKTLKHTDIEDYFKSKEARKELYNNEIKPLVQHNSRFNKLYYLFLIIFALGFLLFMLTVVITFTQKEKPKTTETKGGSYLNAPDASV